MRAMKAQDMQASDLAGFRAALVRQYGNLVRAWKEAIDPTRRGRVGLVGGAAHCTREKARCRQGSSESCAYAGAHKGRR